MSRIKICEAYQLCNKTDGEKCDEPLEDKIVPDDFPGTFAQIALSKSIPLKYNIPRRYVINGSGGISLQFIKNSEIKKDFTKFDDKKRITFLAKCAYCIATLHSFGLYCMDFDLSYFDRKGITYPAFQHFGNFNGKQDKKYTMADDVKEFGAKLIEFNNNITLKNFLDQTQNDIAQNRPTSREIFDKILELLNDDQKNELEKYKEIFFTPNEIDVDPKGKKKTETNRSQEALNKRKYICKSLQYVSNLTSGLAPNLGEAQIITTFDLAFNMQTCDAYEALGIEFIENIEGPSVFSLAYLCFRRAARFASIYSSIEIQNTFKELNGELIFDAVNFRWRPTMCLDKIGRAAFVLYALLKFDPNSIAHEVPTSYDIAKEIHDLADKKISIIKPKNKITNDKEAGDFLKAFDYAFVADLYNARFDFSDSKSLSNENDVVIPMLTNKIKFSEISGCSDNLCAMLRIINNYFIFDKNYQTNRELNKLAKPWIRDVPNPNGRGEVNILKRPIYCINTVGNLIDYKWENFNKPLPHKLSHKKKELENESFT